MKTKTWDMIKKISRSSRTPSWTMRIGFHLKKRSRHCKEKMKSCCIQEKVRIESSKLWKMIFWSRLMLWRIRFTNCYWNLIRRMRYWSRLGLILMRIQKLTLCIIMHESILRRKNRTMISRIQDRIVIMERCDLEVSLRWRIQVICQILSDRIWGIHL